MKAKKIEITQEELHEMFEYIDGKLYNKYTRNSRAIKGSETSTCDTYGGYRKVGIAGKRYPTHRVVWTLLKGAIPEGLEIDHINRQRDDNRIENLRLVTRKENAFNLKSSKGYYKAHGKWRAQISIDNVSTHIGYYDTEAEARKAYLEAKEKYHIILDK